MPSGPLAGRFAGVGAKAGPLLAASSQRVVLACLAAGLSALALPVLLVRLPPLLDYPNHLARLWLISGGIERPPLSEMYAVDWSAASTNIGIDLIAATLGRVTGGDALGPLLLVAALVLPPFGAALLNRAVFGGWHWWQVGFAVLAFNSTLLAGFLNFQIGLGLALLAAAADPALGRRRGAAAGFAARVAMCSALVVFHVFAAAFYAALLAGLAFGAERARPAARVWRAVRVAGSALAVPVAILLLAAPTMPGTHPTPDQGTIAWASYDLVRKATTLLSAVVAYDPWIDMGTVLALWAAARVASSASMLRVHAGLLIAAVGLLALALVVPGSLGGTAFVDWRLPIMALLAAVAAVRPGFQDSRGPAVAACCLLLLALARTAWIGCVWQERQSDVAAVERALGLVPAGAAVLPAQHIPDRTVPAPRGRFLGTGLPGYVHFPALAVTQRAAFVPTLFTAAGKQPLRVRAPWHSISVPEGVPVPAGFLRSFASDPWLAYLVGYVDHWRTRFDYVLLLSADLPDAHGGMPQTPELELLADEGFARLYRIRRGEAASSARGAEHGAANSEPSADRPPPFRDIEDAR